jgi:hypothetical protein
MALVRTGKFISPNAVAYDLQLGFIPDYFELVSALGGTELYLKWYKIVNTLAVAGQYGVVDAAGAKTTPTTAATGVIPYDTTVHGVEVPAPSGDGYVFVPAGAASATKATIADWAAATNYASGGQDRSTTVAGTCVRPPVHNGRVYELTTGAAAGTTAPTTWDVVPGASVTDGGSNVFICREERTAKIGSKGLELGATIMVNGDICSYVAILADESKDHGDGDTTNPG